MPAELPSSQSSPQFGSLKAPQPQRPPHSIPRDIQVDEDSYGVDDSEGASPPPSLLSPAFTPPSTPGSVTPAHNKRTKSFVVDSSTSTGRGPKLLDVLPEVNCVVRARIPTTTGQEMFLHLYTNNIDNKEHLAIVFGPHIRSRSLDEERPGETEMDRMIRGAYTGRLFPGRTTSRADQLRSFHRSRNSSDVSIATKAGRSPPQPQPPLPDPAKPLPASNDSSDQLPITQPSNPPLVRIHSECYTGETVWSARCDCGEQLDEAARLMSQTSTPASPATLSVPPSPTDALEFPPATSDSNPGGVIIYLRQEGRGIGLSEKLKAYNLQDLGSDTVEANILLRHPADARSYGLATAMLVDLGLGGDRGIRLMTNNPDKIRAVEGPGREVRVRERVAMVPLAWKTGGKMGVRSAEVESYLKTKIEQFGHLISNQDEV